MQSPCFTFKFHSCKCLYQINFKFTMPKQQQLRQHGNRGLISTACDQNCSSSSAKVSGYKQALMPEPSHGRVHDVNKHATNCTLPACHSSQIKTKTNFWETCNKQLDPASLQSIIQSYLWTMNTHTAVWGNWK